MLRKRATLIVKTSQGVLLVKHIFPRRWSLPGGGVRSKERPEDAARRELKEELNLDVRKITFLFNLNRGLHRHMVFAVEAKGNIKKNWEIHDYTFIKDIVSSDVPLSGFAVRILTKYAHRKGF